MNNVWVNGAFDVLHIGHIRLLAKAKQFGHVRVGIDSDARIKHMKGPDRPFNTADERAEMLLALKHVDEVVVFNDEEELIECIKDYGPKYMVIGSDYANKTIIGSQFIDHIIFFDRVYDKSTTAILEHAQSNSDRGHL